MPPQESVVYILGAGFSAPLGLPVMGNFLEKAKDLYFKDPDRYEHFKNVFDEINKMAIAKIYYNADLSNIEEILSILEMQSRLTHRKTAELFYTFIADVINTYTPNIPEIRHRPSNWWKFIFPRDNYHGFYGMFCSALLDLQFTCKESLRPTDEINYIVQSEKQINDKYRYSVITLNYDMVLENYCDFTRQYIRPLNDYSFSKPDGSKDISTHLAKLHGSVDNKPVVPPTWNKYLSQRIIPTWQLALKLLSEANHIRVIGYSLPTNDAYIRYLFKAAIIQTEHLKSFDVICLDTTGSVKRRYEEFIDYHKFRYRSDNVIHYLENLSIQIQKSIRDISNPRNVVVYPASKLEMIHELFFNE